MGARAGVFSSSFRIVFTSPFLPAIPAGPRIKRTHSSAARFGRIIVCLPSGGQSVYSRPRGMLTPVSADRACEDISYRRREVTVASVTAAAAAAAVIGGVGCYDGAATIL